MSRCENSFFCMFSFRGWIQKSSQLWCEFVFHSYCHTHTHTHTYIHIYIYVYTYYILCVCLCVYVLVTVSKQKTKFWYLKFLALQRSSLITLYKVYRKNYSLITPKKRWCQIGFSRKMSSASSYSRHNQIDNSKEQCLWEYWVKTHKKLVLATKS